MSGWNHNNGFLCVGGPLHGELRVIPDGQSSFQVMIPLDSSPASVIPPRAGPEKATAMYRVGVYCLQEVRDKTCWVFQE